MDETLRPFVDAEGNLADPDELKRQSVWGFWIALGSIICPVFGPFGLYLSNRVLDYDLPEEHGRARFAQVVSAITSVALLALIVGGLAYVFSRMTYGFAFRLG